MLRFVVLVLVGLVVPNFRPTLATEKEFTGADTDPNACTFNELRGRWIFEMAQGGYDKTINCVSTGKIVRRYQMLLDDPDVVRDDFGNVGFWTRVDALGFEVVIHGRKFFAYVKFQIKGQKTRYCNETILGSSHDVLGRDWACFFGRKVSSFNNIRKEEVQEKKDEVQEIVEREERSTDETSNRQKRQTRMYRTEMDMVDAINAAQSSWTAAHYEDYDRMTIDELMSRAGSRLKRSNSILTPPAMTKAQKKLMAGLPASFDWRNVNGLNYVSPVRDQGKCGSCYAFASAAMNEARTAIFTNLTVKVQFSPQDVVDCTSYSLGCDGGSAYAIAGKYSEDYGMVEESCNPYTGVEGKSCGTKSTCKRYYFTGYEYVGGYYGAATEAQIMSDLVNYGPMPCGILTNEDFMFYKSGIYKPTGISSKGNDFYPVDHAVTLVGYGSDKIHGKYWILKNSWGSKWGDNGFFRLRRGINECGVESMAMQSFPIF